jgi:predicted MPP superfamily phosphohydrolase
MKFHFFRQVIVLVLLVVGNITAAQPELIHLGISGKDYSNTHPAISVTWCSVPGESEQIVNYGTSPALGKTKIATKQSFRNMELFNAALKNLKTATTYYYQCGSENEGWSDVYSFKTEPRKKSLTGFKVGIIGDTQNNIENEQFQKTKEIVSLLKSFSPDLTLHMGDIVENGSITVNWTEFLKVTQKLNTTAPLMPVLGNHDIVNAIGDQFQDPYSDFYNLFNLPGDEVNYSFTYGNVHFIAVFSAFAEGAAKIGKVKLQDDSPEYKWLDNDLSQARNNKKIDWIVVFTHYPVYSFGWSNIAKWKQSLLPLLEKYKVDLCLSGHRHVYERHFQMNKGIPVQNKTIRNFSSSVGTIYITNGTGGGTPQGTGGMDLPTMAFTPDTKMYNFAIMTVKNKSIFYEVFDQSGTKIDWFTINK